MFIVFIVIAAFIIGGLFVYGLRKFVGVPTAPTQADEAAIAYRRYTRRAS